MKTISKQRRFVQLFLRAVKGALATSQFAASLAGVVLVTSCSEKANQQKGNETQPATIEEIIEPGVGVGKVRAKMSIDQVIAELGQPDNKTGHILNYTHLGFSVSPDKNGTVSLIMCGDPSSFGSPLVRSFRGRTKEGIGMGSSPSEVIKALGSPKAEERQPSGLDVWRYPQIGTTFYFDAGKVCYMMINVRSAQ